MTMALKNAHQKVGKSACEKFVYCCSLKSRQRRAESTGVLPPKFRKRRPKSSWNCSHYKEHEQTPLIHQNKVIHGVPLEQTSIFSLNNASICRGHVWQDAIVNLGWKIDPSVSLDARDISTQVSP